MDNLFAAASLGNIAGNIGTLLVALVSVLLLFVGYRYLQRTLRDATSAGPRDRAARAADRWVDFYTREQSIREGHFTRETYRR
jgi:membrane protein implicated in regulation of membrane protease activity